MAWNLSFCSTVILRGLAISFVLALAGMPACTREEAQSDWILRIDGREISHDQYVQRVRQVKKDLGEIPVLDDSDQTRMRQRILAELASEHLMLMEAERRGVTVPASRVARERELLQRKMNDRNWRRFLLEHYVDERAWSADLQRRLTVAALVDLEMAASEPVSAVEIEQFYNANPGRFERPREVHLFQIVVDEASLADELRTRLKKGEDFHEIARQHSLGPEAVRGGDLGYLQASDLPASFRTAFRLKPGTISPIVKTEYGHHIFQIAEVRPAYSRPLDEVENEIRAELEQRRRRAVKVDLVRRLRESAKIEINEELWSKTES